MTNKEIKANRKNLNKLLDFIKSLKQVDTKELFEKLEKW